MRIVACSEEGCERKPLARGLCGMHYQSARKAGALPDLRTAEERFEAFVEPQADGCWHWIGSLDTAGYGLFRVDGGLVKAHRYAWSLANGPILDGLQACHTCDVRVCVNPEHIFLGSAADNMADRNAKGRHAHGIRHGKAVLSEDNVREIRSLLTWVGSIQEIADRFGVTYGCIREIANGHNWRHIK